MLIENINRNNVPLGVQLTTLEKHIEKLKSVINSPDISLKTKVTCLNVLDESIRAKWEVKFAIQEIMENVLDN